MADCAGWKENDGGVGICIARLHLKPVVSRAAFLFSMVYSSMTFNKELSCLPSTSASQNLLLGLPLAAWYRRGEGLARLCQAPYLGGMGGTGLSGTKAKGSGRLWRVSRTIGPHGGRRRRETRGGATHNPAAYFRL